MTRLTARSSTIFIATAEETRVYRSVSEIPVALRGKLHASTNSINSATILIADKRGREELIRALQGHASDVQCRFAETMRSGQSSGSHLTPAAGSQPPTPPKRRAVFSWRRWLEILLPATLAASLWFFIDSHF